MRISSQETQVPPGPRLRQNNWHSSQRRVQRWRSPSCVRAATRIGVFLVNFTKWGLRFLGVRESYAYIG